MRKLPYYRTVEQLLTAKKQEDDICKKLDSTKNHRLPVKSKGPSTQYAVDLKKIDVNTDPNAVVQMPGLYVAL